MTAAVLLALFSGMPSHAQERKAYKIVDKDGKVTYSQTPPADGKDAQKLSTKPAMAGRGGAAGPASGPMSDYSRQYSSQPNHPTGGTNQPSSQEQRQVALKAECERQRGTDCNNPAALQYLDSTSIPRRGRY